MTQPEALRLAERLERYDATRSGYAKHCSLAAAELRRLHKLNQELLAAWKALGEADAPDYIKSSIWEQARAAIANGEQK